MRNYPGVKKTLMLNSLKLAVKMCFSYNVFSLRLRRSEGIKTENLTGTLHRKHESFGKKNVGVLVIILPLDGNVTHKPPTSLIHYQQN